MDEIFLTHFFKQNMTLESLPLIMYHILFVYFKCPKVYIRQTRKTLKAHFLAKCRNQSQGNLNGFAGNRKHIVH